MVWSFAEVPADYEARYAADLPMLVARNQAGTNNAVAQWRTSGSWASGSSSTYSDGVLSWATSRAWDDRAEPRTRATALSAGQVYLIFDLQNVTFDVAAIVGHNFGTAGTTRVRIQIADDNAFTTRLQTIADWNGAPWLGSSTTRRLVSVTLGAGVHVGVTTAAQYSGVRYLRILFDSTTPPEIGEVWLGVRYPPPNRPNFPDDESRTETATAEAESEAGVQHAVTQWSGRLVFTPTWWPDSVTYANLFRDAFAYSGYGTKPFLYLPNPSTSTRSAYVMRTDPRLAVIQTSGSAREVRLPMREQAPFVSKET